MHISACSPVAPRVTPRVPRPARRVLLGIAALSPGLGTPGGVAAQPAAPLTGIAPARFAALRWLAGEWRGRAADGAWFYERYRVVDDSTIQMTGFADSTFTRGTDGDRIVLRGGAVRYENVVATRLDSAGVDFAAPSGRSGFTWARAGAEWTATIWQADSAAGPRRTQVYHMEPYAPPAPKRDGSAPADSAAAARLRELVEVVNTGRPSAMRRFVARRFGPPDSPARVEWFQREHVRAFDRERGWELVRVWPTGPGEVTGDLRGRLTGQRATAVLAVEPAPPYRVTRLPRALGADARYEPAPGDAAARTDAARVRELERFLAVVADADAFSGTVLVARSGRVLLARGYGYADRERRLAAGVDTRYDLASMTKMFTAVAVAQLAERGRLSLDDTLGRWLPAFPNAEARSRVRLKHLLSHTSGLDDYGGSDAGYRGPPRVNTVGDALAAVERAQSGRLRHAPGTRHAYLNAGFTILGRVVELASGEDYYAYVERHVFRPAGMAHTGWFRADRSVANRAAYRYRAHDADARPWRRGGGSPTDLRGNAETGAWSTAPDLWRFAEALRRGTLVSPAAVRALWSPKPELGAPEWGYGFAVEQVPGLGRVVGHGGTGGPVSTCMDLFLDGEATVVVLANTPAGRTSPRAKIRALLAAPGEGPR